MVTSPSTVSTMASLKLILNKLDNITLTGYIIYIIESKEITMLSLIMLTLIGCGEKEDDTAEVTVVEESN